MIAFKRILAGAALTGALGVAGMGIGSAVAEAAPPSPTGPGMVWAQDHNGGGRGGNDWYGGGGRGNGWNNGGWNNGPGWGPQPYWGGGPVPGGWNGGWEPNGGFCLGGLCV